jgi:hypothetical protein
LDKQSNEAQRDEHDGHVGAVRSDGIPVCTWVLVYWKIYVSVRKPLCNGGVLYRRLVLVLSLPCWQVRRDSRSVECGVQWQLYPRVCVCSRVDDRDGSDVWRRPVQHWWCRIVQCVSCGDARRDSGSDVGGM